MQVHKNMCSLSITRNDRYLFFPKWGGGGAVKISRQMEKKKNMQETNETKITLTNS